MKARSYQTRASREVIPQKVNLIVSPMRSGKSYIMKLIHDRLEPKKTLIIVGYRKIVLQLQGYFDSSSFILSGKSFDKTKAVHIATFQTIANRDIDLSQYDLIMQDEYHSRLSKRAQDIVFQKDCTVCLFTGTPLDNKNRRLTKGIDSWIQPVSIQEMIDNAWLAPTRFLVNGNMLVKHSTELEGNRLDFDEKVVRRIIQREDLLVLIKDLIVREELDTTHNTVIYVNYIETANELYELLSNLNNVNIVHSKMSQKAQDEALERYQSTEGIVISVRSLSLGWDSPVTDRVIYGLFSKIHSNALQMLWRGSTIDPNNPEKETIVYDMVGQLDVVNPYTDFKEYGKHKDSCREQCMEFPENSIARDICLESCTTPEEMFIVCNGEPSFSFEQDPYKSNFKTQGTPCKEGHPFYEYTYWTKRPKDSIGILYKYSECPCGFTTRYTLETMTQPSKVVEMYQEHLPQNSVMILVKPKSSLALLIIDDVKEKKSYIYKYVKGQEGAYEALLRHFRGRKFSIISNLSLNKLKGSKHEPKLDYLLQYVDWEDINGQEVMRQLITSRIRGHVARAGFKQGYTYLMMAHVNSQNEKEVYSKVKNKLGKQALKTLFKKLERQ